jgi:hypothetical protein
VQRAILRGGGHSSVCGFAFVERESGAAGHIREKHFAGADRSATPGRIL